MQEILDFKSTQSFRNDTKKDWPFSGRKNEVTSICFSPDYFHEKLKCIAADKKSLDKAFSNFWKMESKGNELEVIEFHLAGGLATFSSESEDSANDSDRVIELSRELLSARQEIKKLRDERNNPESRDFGHSDILLKKTHVGKVSKVIGQQAEIVYQISKDHLTTQIYDMTQFCRGKKLDKGDAVEACVILSKTIDIDDSEDTLEPVPDFQHKAKKGIVDF